MGQIELFPFQGAKIVLSQSCSVCLFPQFPSKPIFFPVKPLYLSMMSLYSLTLFLSQPQALNLSILHLPSGSFPFLIYLCQSSLFLSCSIYSAGNRQSLVSYSFLSSFFLSFFFLFSGNTSETYISDML